MSDQEKNKSMLLSCREAANFLGITASTLAVWRIKKKFNIPVVRIGSLCKYKLSDLENFIKEEPLYGQEQKEKFNNDKLLTRKEAANFLGISAVTLGLWTTKNLYKVPTMKFGGRYKYSLSELTNFIEQQRITS